jgi:hypothetical protein
MSRQEKRRSSLAKRNFWNAGTRIRSAEIFLSQKDWSDAIREGKEAIDFISQALLFFSGIERNRFQPPGPMILSLRERIPFPENTDWQRLESLLDEAPSTQEASPFGGGDFMTFGEPFTSGSAPPSTPEDAKKLLDDVRYLAKICRYILRAEESGQHE